MGVNCSNCSCSNDQEVTLVDVSPYEREKRKMKAIVKVQAWVRGWRARRQIKVYKLSLKEYKTLPSHVKSGIKKDGIEEKVENRPEHVFKNGAKYLG